MAEKPQAEEKDSAAKKKKEFEATSKALEKFLTEVSTRNKLSLQFDFFQFQGADFKGYSFEKYMQIYYNVSSQEDMEKIPMYLTAEPTEVKATMLSKSVFHSEPAPVLLYQSAPETGEQIPVAMVDSNRLFIFFNIMELKKEDCIRVMSKIMEMAEGTLCENIRSYDYSREKAQFRKLQADIIKNSIETTRRQVAENEKRVTSLIKDMADTLNLIETDKILLEAFDKSAEDEVIRRSDRELEAIFKMSPGAFLKIELGLNEIRAYTHTLHVQEGKETYLLGKFLITIKFKENAIHIKNLTNEVEGYQAPHIHDESNICWGNISTSIGKLLGKREYAGVLAVVLTYLQSYNDKDKRIPLNRWPLVPEPTAEAKAS